MNKKGNLLIIVIVVIIIFIVAGLVFYFTMYNGAEQFNNANKVVNESASKISTLAISSFNASYEMYEGERVSPAAVKQLISKYNADKANEDKKEYVENLVLNGISSADEVNTAKTYNVKFEYAQNGLVSTINITEN